jgi:hypothetical protein
MSQKDNYTKQQKRKKMNHWNENNHFEEKNAGHSASNQSFSDNESLNWTQRR